MSPVEAAVAAPDLLSALIRQLCRLLNADLVFAGSLAEGSNCVRALAACTPSGEIDAFDYELLATPCAGVQTGIECYAEGVRGLFPADRRLAEMSAEGFIGAPLYGRGGRCIGMLCAITRQALKDPAGAQDLLLIAAMSAGSELQTSKSGEFLARAEERWRSFALHSNEAILRFALEKPIPLNLPEDEVIELAYRDAYAASGSFCKTTRKMWADGNLPAGWRKPTRQPGSSFCRNANRGVRFVETPTGEFVL
jgi:hypothetical protein